MCSPAARNRMAPSWVTGLSLSGICLVPEKVERHSISTPGTPVNLEECSVKVADGWCLIYVTCVTWHCAFRSACCLPLDHHCLSFEILQWTAQSGKSNCITLFGASSDSRGRCCLMGRGTLIRCTSTSHADIIPGEVHHNGSLAWTGTCHSLNDISATSVLLFTIQTISLKNEKKKILHYCTSFPLRKDTKPKCYGACLHILSAHQNHFREPHKSLSHTESMARLMLSLHFNCKFFLYI